MSVYQISNSHAFVPYVNDTAMETLFTNRFLYCPIILHISDLHTLYQGWWHFCQMIKGGYSSYSDVTLSIASIYKLTRNKLLPPNHVIRRIYMITNVRNRSLFQALPPVHPPSLLAPLPQVFLLPWYFCSSRWSLIKGGHDMETLWNMSVSNTTPLKYWNMFLVT